MPDDRSARAFKTAWFSKAARKARIRDGALLQAVREAMLGQPLNEGDLLELSDDH